MIRALLGLAAGAYLFLKTRKSSDSGGEATRKRLTKEPPSAGHEFHAVAVRFDSKTACEAVEALKGERFLSNEVPSLPLPECDSADCRCRYLHFEDRRDGDDDRRLATSALRESSGEADRRDTRGRRTSD